MTDEAGGPVQAPAPEAEGEAVFVCGTCGGSFAAEEVYDDQGVIICQACFARRAASVRQAISAEKKEEPAPLPMPAKAALKVRATCPHCWHAFPPAQVLWVAEHAELMGDVVLGPEAQARFLPSRFTPSGNAIDARGVTCHQLACPRCHLTIPRLLLGHDPLFLSIVGVQASGKSYFLTAMTWELRRRLGPEFGIRFDDADVAGNRFLNEYEQMLFLAADPDRPVVLEPTQREGHLYDSVRIGGEVMSLARPLMFVVGRGNPKRGGETRVVCLYDNAGEHFRAGEDRASSPVTRHLAMAGVLMFLFDPTQDPRFRERLRAVIEHPQIATGAKTERQDVVLREAASRVRKYAGLPPDAVHERPMIVVVGKSDVWEKLVDADLQSEPVVVENGVSKLDFGRIEATSAKVRALFMELAPEFVAAAEGFCRHVIYIPVSAIGRAPEEGGFVRPRDIRPRWVTVPVLYMLGAWARGWVEGVG